MSLSFKSLIDNLTVRLREPLPGANAHEKMRAMPTGKIVPNFEHKVPPKPGSVLILLYPLGNEIFFPLIQRPEYSGAHSGQVSLPGGKAEIGEDAITTALREGEEEIGIKRNEVEVIGKLSDFFVMPSNFMVTPILGFCTAKPEFKPDPIEVERILHGNLLNITSADSIKSKEILAAGKFKMIAPHFEIENQVVWGATAMMLNELREVIQSVTR